MKGCLSVFVTTSSRQEAENIARVAVEENHAACANILPAIHSLYRWKGRVEEAQECALILKTTAEKFDLLQRRIIEIHSYECPCIVATEIVAGSEEFLNWIKE